MSGPTGLDRDARPRIDPVVVPVTISPDEVHFRSGPWSGPIATLTDESRDGTLAAIVDSLDGTLTAGEILDRFDRADEDDIRTVISELEDRKIVSDAAESPDTAVVERSPLPVRFSQRDRDVLDAKTVLLVSNGRLCDRLASMLSRAGVGTVDVRHGGDMPTDSSVTGRIFDPTDERLRADVRAADMVVFAVERPWRSAVERVNAAVQDTGTPLLCAEAVGYDLSVGPTVLPGETACYECYAARRRMNLEAPERYDEFERQMDAPFGPFEGALPFPELVGSLAATDAVNYLCYGYGFTVGKTITVDVSSFAFEANQVLRLPRCDACGPHEGEVGYDSLFTVRSLVERMREEEPDEH